MCWSRGVGEYINIIVIRQKYSETSYRRFAYSRFDSKIIRFNTSYFSYDGKNGIQSSKSNGKGSQFEYNFVIICRYLKTFYAIRDHRDRDRTVVGFTTAYAIRHHRDRIVVGFTTTYAISAYHHKCC
jgi:hypothetical protein